MLGRQKCIQLSHYCLNLVLSSFKLLLKSRNYKLQGIDQILAELIQAGDNTLCFEIHKLIIPIWYKEELLQQWKESVTVHIYIRGKKMTVVIVERYHCYQLRTATDQIFCICQMLEKKWEYSLTVRKLFIDFEKAHDSGEEYYTVFSLNLVYI